MKRVRAPAAVGAGVLLLARPAHAGDDLSTVVWLLVLVFVSPVAALAGGLLGAAVGGFRHRLEPFPVFRASAIGAGVAGGLVVLASIALFLTMGDAPGEAVGPFVLALGGLALEAVAIAGAAAGLTAWLRRRKDGPGPPGHVDPPSGLH